jgi:hypothetical protein
VTHGNDLDAAARVVNDVEHAVVADPNSIRVMTVELDGAGPAGRRPQANDASEDPVVCRSRETAQLELGRPLEQNLIRHAVSAARQPRTAAEILPDGASRLSSALLDDGRIDDILSEMSIAEELFHDRPLFGSGECAERGPEHFDGSISGRHRLLMLGVGRYRINPMPDGAVRRPT